MRKYERKFGLANSIKQTSAPKQKQPQAKPPNKKSPRTVCMNCNCDMDDEAEEDCSPKVKHSDTQCEVPKTSSSTQSFVPQQHFNQQTRPSSTPAFNPRMPFPM